MSFVPHLSHIDLTWISDGTLDEVLSLVYIVGLMILLVGAVLDFLHFLYVKIHLVYASE